MQILPITKNRINLSFRSCVRQYPAGYGGDTGLKPGQVLTSTALFREDLDWKFLRDCIIGNFKDKERVNSYSLAASDGSEAYSYVIALIDKIPQNEYKKFFPIFASDTDFESIKAANSGRINLSINDFVRMENVVEKEKDYFIDSGKPISISNNKTPLTYFYESYRPIKDVRDAVIFKQADLLDELRLILDSGNSVVMARNVALYLKNDYVEKIAKSAGEVLKKGSLFVTGIYDKKMSMLTEGLVKNGFKEIQPLIYKKI